MLTYLSDLLHILEFSVKFSWGQCRPQLHHASQLGCLSVRVGCNRSPNTWERYWWCEQFSEASTVWLTSERFFPGWSSAFVDYWVKEACRIPGSSCLFWANRVLRRVRYVANLFVSPNPLLPSAVLELQLNRLVCLREFEFHNFWLTISF